MHVLITGASGGLGTSVCKTFQDAGWTVTGVALAWPAPQSFRTIAADLTTAEGCEAAVAEAGPIDALVHLLGGFAGGQSIAETSDQTWDSMMNLNLRAAFFSMRAALKAGAGRIVAVGARPAVEPLKNFAAYSVSKAGLVALVNNIAAEGVTANAVLPSVIDTPGNRKSMPNADFSKWVAPEKIAQAILWLASQDEISGAAIPIYGRS
jgi:NAD(P)-dependent dehydrogenase (short-subunit alcohol dehydrogenase family)